MHHESEMLIIGGGLAGLSTGCYAQMNGFKTRILEHNLELGGVCTAWRRGPYLIDGCIHWLMGAAPGGMFRRVYEELGVLRDVELRGIEVFHQYEDPARGKTVEFGRDAGRFREDLVRLSPGDAAAIDRLLSAAEATRELVQPVDNPPELATVLDRLKLVWEMRHLAGTLLHFRGTLGEWCQKEIRGAALSDYLSRIVSPEMPVIFLPVLLQHQFDGQMSRPVGGSGRFRDAIEGRYRELGGEVMVHTTVEEILVKDDRAIGVRLTDGTQLFAETIVSTASIHETLLRLLGGRYLNPETRLRLDEWPTFEPIVVLSAGLEAPLADAPSSLVVRQPSPLAVGGRPNDTLYLRIYNDDHSFAPEGHTVIQTLLPTRYDWWASLGPAYDAEKRRVADRVLELVDRRFPGAAAAVRLTDIATPLTFWRHVRSWRGAYEGWLPTPETFRTHVPKTAPGLMGLHLAGQWVEPGGGVPPALVSGRQVVQILCSERGVPFRTAVPAS